MNQERFSNLTVLNSHKERTAKFAPHPPLQKRWSSAPHSKNCSAGPVLVSTGVNTEFKCIFRLNAAFFIFDNDYDNGSLEGNVWAPVLACLKKFTMICI